MNNYIDETLENLIEKKRTGHEKQHDKIFENYKNKFYPKNARSILHYLTPLSSYS